MKRLILAFPALEIITGISACGGSAPATNAQAQAAGYKYGDTMAALGGFMDMVGDGAKLPAPSMKIYCEVAELEKGGMPPKWMGHGSVSVTPASQLQSGCIAGIGAEATANTP